MKSIKNGSKSIKNGSKSIENAELHQKQWTPSKKLIDFLSFDCLMDILIKTELKSNENGSKSLEIRHIQSKIDQIQSI